MRRALSDSQALVYLGFAESSNADALAAGVSDVKGKRAQLNSRLDALALKREEVARSGDVPASAADDAPSNLSEVELGEIAREIEDGKRELAKMDAQVSARTRALPLYQATLGGDDLADALRQRRDHPMHALLRRMYHEQRSLAEGDEK